MGLSLYVTSVDIDTLNSLSSDTALQLVVDEGWSADQLGWAVPGLLFGEQGVAVFGHPVPDMFGDQVQVMDARVVRDLATRPVNVETMRVRFGDKIFGPELGPVPSEGDENWLVESAESLRDLLVHAYERGRWVLFTFV